MEIAKPFCNFSAVSLSVIGVNETGDRRMATFTKRRNGDGSRVGINR